LNETRKQWRDLHQLLYDENSLLPPPLSEQQRETLLQTRQDRLDTIFELGGGDGRGEEEQERRKEKSGNAGSKAWKLGYL
jgi:hypothetical protein